MAPAQRMIIEIRDKSGNRVGSIEKEYFGLVNECFTMADKYNFDYPSTQPDH